MQEQMCGAASVRGRLHYFQLFSHDHEVVRQHNAFNKRLKLGFSTYTVKQSLEL